MRKAIVVLLGAMMLGTAHVSGMTVSGQEMSWNVGGDKKFTKKDKKGIAVIKSFYNTYYRNWSERNDCSHISKILTSKCINKLANLYEYDGDGLAMWTFWKLNTDEGEDAGYFVSRSIIPTGNGWFRVTNKHENRSEVLRIRVVETKDGWKIDDVVNGQ